MGKKTSNTHERSLLRTARRGSIDFLTGGLCRD